MKQNASAVVAEVAAGEVITITDRGRPVAQLIPYVEDHLARLVASGRVRPATRRFSDLRPPVPAGPDEPSLIDVLDEMREDRI